ncbi:MAG TPA: hypothetical protein VGJ84_11190, partial [Polyangiaceae bacterium]
MSESDSIWRRPINPSRLRINDAGRTHCWPDWSWSTVGRPFSDFDLWVVLGGRGKLTTPEVEVSLFPAVCFLLRPEGYAGTTEKKNPLVVSHTHFDILDQGGHPWRPGPVGWPRLWRVAEDLLLLDGMLKRLFAAHLQSPNSDEARHWLSAALLEVARQDERDTGPAPQREL